MVTATGRFRDSTRRALGRAGLLPVARKLLYWASQFDRASTHPRRVLRRFYEPFVRSGTLVFDVGANIGQRSDIFLELGAKVVAVEPQPFCIAALRERFASRPELTIVPKGLGPVDGVELEIAICDALDAISSMSPAFRESSRFRTRYGYTWSRRERVAITTLDALIDEFGIPAFCKIDVEGFEEEVLRGLTVPLPCLSFEFNLEFAPIARACAHRLLSLGDYRFNFGLAEPTALLSPQWMTVDALFELLSRHGDPLLWGDIYARQV